MKLILIDPNFSHSSPSMKGTLRALPQLKAAGWTLEAWCWNCDEGLPLDHIVRLPRFGNIFLLAPYAFTFWASLWAKFRAWLMPTTELEVIYTIATYQPWCDIAHVHFSCWDWEQAQQRLGTHSARDWYERITNFAGLIAAEVFFRLTTARVVLCVSDGVADDVRKRAPHLNTQVLPNSYDPQRFHTGVRDLHRAEARNRLGFTEQDVVFNFTSTGHYRRKGFLLAVSAIFEVRALGHSQAKLLIVGGTDRHRAELKQQLDIRHPDWPSFVVFAGATRQVEREFAASDAFLFPSHSEAFGLVSLEAAACGLPLFLTRHQGAAMLMQDGVNGRYLEPDAKAIAAVLAEFITGAWKPQPTKLSHALDSDEFAARFIQHVNQSASSHR